MIFAALFTSNFEYNVFYHLFNNTFLYRRNYIQGSVGRIRSNALRNVLRKKVFHSYGIYQLDFNI